MPSLRDRIETLWSRLRGEQSDPTTTLDLIPRPAQTGLDWAKKLRGESDRRDIIQVCQEMYRTDPRAKGVIQTLARDVVKGGCTVSVANNPKAQEAADELFARLNLDNTFDDYIRLTLRDGDSFVAVGVDDQNLIAALQRLPTLQLQRNSNQQDTFDDPTQAFWQHERAGWNIEPPSDAIWYSEWECIHARWDHDQQQRYGTPLFAAAIGAWKRIREGELDISIRRKSRAGLRYLHVLEGASPADIEEYQERNKEALSNQFAAVSDFFTNRKGAIDTVQGDAQLGDIRDVSHHIDTWWLASPVPKALLGYGQDLNRDVLQEQYQQYQVALETISEWVTDELVVPLLERQWLLLGIWPDDLEYSVEWATKVSLTPDLLERVARAIVSLKASGLFTEETLLRFVSRFVAGFDWQAEAEALEQLRAQMPDEIHRIAQMMIHRNDQEPEEDEEEPTPRRVDV